MSSDRHRRVVDQFKARLPAIPIEVMWGMGSAVPTNFKPPPEWVKKALQRVTKELGLVRGTVEGMATPYLMGKYTGLATTATAATAVPFQEEVAIPALKELREIFAVWLAAIVPAFTKATEAEQQLAAPKIAGDFKASYAGAADGAAFVTDEDAADMTMMGDLSYWMWLFWPQVEAMRTRVEAFAFIQEMEFVSCSFKLFEKLCQEIGYSPDRRV